ncbi:MAG: MmgE/PrpD family protein [Alphaproteobacteria bacterium]|nr:MmgE/PrpD family protein [Alphaproteobacteria bacterium]
MNVVSKSSSSGVSAQTGRSTPGAGLTPTKALSAHAAGLRFTDLDAATAHGVRRHTLDTLASCIAASREHVTRVAESTLTAIVPAGTIPVPGLKGRFDVLTAAYLGGAEGHGLDVDDGYTPGSVHPGSVMVPAVLSFGHDRGISGQQAMTAIAVGYEIAGRIAQATHPKPRWRGFHNTAVAGVFGAAGAIGNLIGSSAKTIEDSFALAASNASGLFTFLHGAGDIKRLHAGQAARDGILCALLAKNGIPGAENVLEVKDGYFHAYAGGDVDPARYADIDIFFGGQPSVVSRCYIKPYLCCRHIHTALDCLIAIMQQHKLAAADIKDVHVGTYAVSASHAKVGWDNFAQAQMSFQFCMATGMHYGAVALEHFSQAALRNPAVLADCSKFKVETDPECDAAYPKARPSVVTVRTIDGRTLTMKRNDPKGDPADPLTDEELFVKFHALADPVFGRSKSERVRDMVWGIDELASVSALTEALAG